MVVGARLVALKNRAGQGATMSLRVSQGMAGRTKIKITTGNTGGQCTSGQITIITSLLGWLETHITGTIASDHGHTHSSGTSEVVVYIDPLKEENAAAQAMLEGSAGNAADGGGASASPKQQQQPESDGGVDDEGEAASADSEAGKETSGSNNSRSSETEEMSDEDDENLDTIASTVMGSAEVIVLLTEAADTLRPCRDIPNSAEQAEKHRALLRLEHLVKQERARHLQLAAKQVAFEESAAAKGEG